MTIKIDALEEAIKLSDQPAKPRSEPEAKSSDRQIMPKLQAAFRNLLKRHQDAMFTEEEAKRMLFVELRKELNDDKITERIKGIIEDQFSSFT